MFKNTQKNKLILLSLYHVPIIIIAMVVIAPILWFVIGSLKPGYETFSLPPNLSPKSFIYTNYPEVFQRIPLQRYFLNSTVVMVVYVFLALFLSSLGGFAFAKYNFPLQNILFIFILSTMMVPIHVLLVPLYLLMDKIHWLDTLYPLMIPFDRLPMGIFFMRQFIFFIPLELIDAARIDGCSEFKIYYRIILPICKPALAALGIFLGVFSWNAFLWPLVILNSESNYTLPIGIANFVYVTEQLPEWGLIFAGCVLSALPPVIIFVFLQRYFVKGILLGSIKG